MLAIAKSSSSGDVAVRSHTPPAPALRAEKSSTAASCRGGRSPASTSTGGLHRGTVAATGPAASGSESMCTQRCCGQRGARHLRWRGATRRLVTSVGLVDLHNDNLIGPRPRPSSALRGAGGRSTLRPVPPWEPPRLPRTKPGNTTKLGSSYETEQGRNGKITDVLSHDGYFDERHDCLRPPDCVLSRATAHRRPGLPHTRGTLVRHASLRRRTRHLSSPSSACGLAWEEPMGASSPHLVAALSLAVNTRSSSSKLSFLAFSMAPLAL